MLETAQSDAAREKALLKNLRVNLVKENGVQPRDDLLDLLFRYHEADRDRRGAVQDQAQLGVVNRFEHSANKRGLTSHTIPNHRDNGLPRFSRRGAKT